MRRGQPAQPISSFPDLQRNNARAGYSAEERDWMIHIEAQPREGGGRRCFVMYF